MHDAEAGRDATAPHRGGVGAARPISRQCIVHDAVTSTGDARFTAATKNPERPQAATDHKDACPSRRAARPTAAACPIRRAPGRASRRTAQPATGARGRRRSPLGLAAVAVRGHSDRGQTRAPLPPGDSLWSELRERQGGAR